MQKGDEYYSWIETTDGYSVVKNTNGIFEYAILNNNGNLVPSGVKVKNVDKRTSAEIAFIVSIPQLQIRTKLSVQQNEIMKSKMSEMPAKVETSVIGIRKVLCILIGFTDLPFSKTQNEFNNLMNQTGYNANLAVGSVKDYYLETSYGQLNLEVTVVGPYTANHNMAYYGADSYDSSGQLITRYLRVRDLITEAVQKANLNVDYNDYDYDGDGYVDGIHVIFAGYDQAAGGPTDAIWSHKWQISKIQLDNKWIKTYSCSSELRENYGNTIATIGTACHEFGHVLGAPDMYDVLNDNVDYLGTGEWDLMAHGSWNGSWVAPGNCPAHINPYTKINTFGWASAKSLPADNSLVTLYPANSDSNSFYKIPTPTSGEYFLMENRQWLGFDTFLPGHGILIWHVHKDLESDRYAINITHPQRLYPICASATQNPTSIPASYGTINGGGCPFPGTSTQRSLTFSIIPGLRSWAGASTGKDIQFITETGNNVTFVVNPQIFGPTQICTQGTYTIENFPAGATVQWSASPAGFVSSIQANGNSATVTTISNGAFTLNATVTLSGNTIGLTKQITVVGNPYINYYSSNNLMMLDDENTYFQVLRNYDNSQYQGSLTVSTSDGATVQWSKISGTMGWSSYQNTVSVFNKKNSSLVLQSSANNSCGSATKRFYFYIGPTPLLIYPNPATDILTVETEAIEAVPGGEMNVSAETLSLADSDLRIKPYIIQLWHERQGLVRSVKSTKRVTQISLHGLPKGMYFVHVQKEGEAVQKQMLWVR